MARMPMVLLVAVCGAYGARVPNSPDGQKNAHRAPGSAGPCGLRSRKLIDACGSAVPGGTAGLKEIHDRWAA